eukprot:4718081-Lingulodinium_polyedra.AAC.1
MLRRRLALRARRLPEPLPPPVQLPGQSPPRRARRPCWPARSTSRSRTSRLGRSRGTAGTQGPGRGARR